MTKISGLRKTSEVGQNPKDAYGAAKVPLGVIPPTADIFLGMAMGEGARKYGAYNFRVAKVQALTYLEAAKRHLLAVTDGEDFDPETGIPHLAFVMACAAIVADAWVNNCLIDNRPVPGKTGALLSALNLKPGLNRTPEQVREAFESVITAHTGHGAPQPQAKAQNNTAAYDFDSNQ